MFRSCPQFDATQATLTGREHLHLYARLRGVRPAARRTAMVERLLTQVCACARGVVCVSEREREPHVTHVAAERGSRLG